MIMTKAAFAIRMGVDRAQPTRWAARGMPVLADGRVDVDAAEGWVAGHVDSTQRRRRSIGARTGRGADPSPLADYVPPLACMRHLDNPADMGVVLFTMTLAYRTPSNAAILAVGAGASVAVAREMLGAVQIATMQEVEELLDAAGVPPPPGFDAWAEAGIWEIERFPEVDWPAMEKAVAERGPGSAPVWKLPPAEA
jgi:hypothetical protein